MMTRRELLASFACMALASSVVGEGQPMEQRISIVTLGVKNLAVSRRFYVDGLGWKPVYEDKEIIFFQTGGMVFALFLRDKLAEDFSGESRHVRTRPHGTRLQCSHQERSGPVDEARWGRRRNGLKSAAQATWGGYSGYFADPDGFAWEVAWNPNWRMTPDGSIHIPAPNKKSS